MVCTEDNKPYKGFIAGWQHVSLVDVPGHVATTLFLAGCPFRCPFCHNRGLVLPEEIPDPAQGYRLEAILDYLERRTGLIDAVCISGGEPLMREDVTLLLTQLRQVPVRIKLDTNGAYPELLARILEAGWVDSVAMDIKNSPARYAETCGVAVDLARIRRSVELLTSWDGEVEFRTTVVRDFHTLSDLERVAEWGISDQCWVLTGFRDGPGVIRAGLSGYSPEELHEMTDVLRKKGFPNVSLREDGQR